MKIYVGNLSYDVTGEELRGEFVAFGKVESVSLITDKYDGRPRGFGFVEMPSLAEAQQAIVSLNGKNLKGRTLAVSASKPRSDDRSGGYRVGGDGGRDGGGGRR